MSTTGMVAAAAVAVVVACVAACTLWRTLTEGRRRLRNRIAHEQATGHAGVRRRIKHTVGRRTDTFQDVLRAETMPGWVWFYWTRRPGESYRERTGWAPTRGLARRRLARTVDLERTLRSSARR